MPNTVLVTGPNLAPAAVSALQAAGYRPVFLPAYTDEAGLLSAVIENEPVGIISRMGKISGMVLEAAPTLRVISKHGLGVDNIDVEAASRRGVPVVVASGANAISVAEHTIALLLAVAKRITSLDRGLREGRWEKPGYSGREIAGSKMGLIGFGAIAQQTARLAKVFDVELFAYDPFPPRQAFDDASVHRVEHLDELVATCDVVSLHCPLTPETMGLINAARLSQMRSDAILINTARGGLIDEEALADALASGRIAGAGLDTFAQEPPRHDHPFFREPRAVLTPHIGGVTEAANARVGVEAAQGIIEVLAGRSLPEGRIVNIKRLARLEQGTY